MQLYHTFPFLLPSSSLLHPNFSVFFSSLSLYVSFFFSLYFLSTLSLLLRILTLLSFSIFSLHSPFYFVSLIFTLLCSLFFHSIYSLYFYTIFLIFITTFKSLLWFLLLDLFNFSVNILSPISLYFLTQFISFLSLLSYSTFLLYLLSSGSNSTSISPFVIISFYYSHCISLYLLY